MLYYLSIRPQYGISMIHSPTWGTLEQSNKNTHSQEKNQTHVRCRRQKHANINTKSHQKFYLKQGCGSQAQRGRAEIKQYRLLCVFFPFSSQSSDNKSIKGLTKTTKGTWKPSSLPLKVYSGYRQFQKSLQRVCPLLKKPLWPSSHLSVAAAVHRNE